MYHPQAPAVSVCGDVALIEECVANEVAGVGEEGEGVRPRPLPPAFAVAAVQLPRGHTGPDVPLQEIHVSQVPVAVFTHFVQIVVVPTSILQFPSSRAEHPSHK